MFEQPILCRLFYAQTKTLMTEQTLKHLAMDGLVDLLLLSVTEFLEALEKKDEIGVRVKRKQIELLQGVIQAKKIELSHR